MFYRPEDGHGLPHNPFNALITPRPIGWISSRDAAGHDNLAPYSFFNGVAYVPPQVMFASTGQKPDRDGTKDSMGNIRETGVFCVNVVEYAMRDRMNASSASMARGRDEFVEAGIAKAECDTIDCPRVEGAPANLECRVTQIVRIARRGEFRDIWRSDRHPPARQLPEGRHLRRDQLPAAGPAGVSRLCPRHRAFQPEASRRLRPDQWLPAKRPVCTA